MNFTIQRVVMLIALILALTAVAPVTPAIASSGDGIRYYVSVNNAAFMEVPSSYTVPANAASTSTARTLALKIIRTNSFGKLYGYTKTIRWYWTAKKVTVNLEQNLPEFYNKLFLSFTPLCTADAMLNPINWYNLMSGQFGWEIEGVAYHDIVSIVTQAKPKGECKITFTCTK